MLHDSTYRKRAMAVSTMLKSSPRHPATVAAEHIEQAVARHQQLEALYSIPTQEYIAPPDGPPPGPPPLPDEPATTATSLLSCFSECVKLTFAGLNFTTDAPFRYERPRQATAIATTWERLQLKLARLSCRGANAVHSLSVSPASKLGACLATASGQAEPRVYAAMVLALLAVLEFVIVVVLASNRAIAAMGRRRGRPASHPGDPDAAMQERGGDSLSQQYSNASPSISDAAPTAMPGHEDFAQDQGNRTEAPPSSAPPSPTTSATAAAMLQQMAAAATQLMSCTRSLSSRDEANEEAEDGEDVSPTGTDDDDDDDDGAVSSSPSVSIAGSSRDGGVLVEASDDSWEKP